MKFIICAPPYRTNSVGVVVLHALARLLREVGEEAVLYDSDKGLQPPDQFTAQGVPYLSEPAQADDIVILPEVMNDHWWRAHASAALGLIQRRVWYLLNRPIYLTGQPVEYHPQDYLISYTDFIDDTVPSLPILISEPELFHPPTTPKPGNVAAIYYGKWVGEQNVPDLQDFLRQFSVVHVITRTWPEDRKELARLLREASVLVTFDCLTGMIGEALTCHTPVMMMEDHFQLCVHGSLGIRNCGIFREAHQFSRAQMEAPTWAPRLAQAIAGNADRVRDFAQDAKAHFESLAATLPDNRKLEQKLERWVIMRRQLDVLRYQMFQAETRFEDKAGHGKGASKFGGQRPEAPSHRISLICGASAQVALTLDIEGSNEVQKMEFGPIQDQVWPAAVPLLLAWESLSGWLELHSILLNDASGATIACWPGEDLLLELGEGSQDLPGGKKVIPWRLLTGTPQPRIVIHSGFPDSTPRAIASVVVEATIPVPTKQSAQLALEFKKLKLKGAQLWQSKPVEQWTRAASLAHEKLEALNRGKFARFLLPMASFSSFQDALAHARKTEVGASPDRCARAWRNAAELALDLLEKIRATLLGSHFIRLHLIEKCRNLVAQANASATSD